MNFFRILIISSMIALFTGCGGGGSGGTDIASANNITPQTAAIDIIIAYADDNTQPSPTVGDYFDAGITGVNADNLVNVNMAVDALIGTDVDTIAEIQAVVDEVIATLAATAASDAVLVQIGLEADNPDKVDSVVTLAQLGDIQGLIGVDAANITAYQDYIDNNPDAFLSPATLAEVQAMADAVNAEQAAIAASNAVLSQIGLEADNPDSVNSIVTVTQLGTILPALTDINSTNEAAYQDYIDVNPDTFASPATLAEVQAMVNTVNVEQEAIAVSASVLVQIGAEGDTGDGTNSVVTAAQLGNILGLTSVVAGNETAYQDYIDANPDAFSDPATLAEVQAMIDTVNAEQEAIAVSASVLVQIGAEGDTGDGTNSVVTAAQLENILGLTSVVAGNETAYQDYIDANPDAFSDPATLAEVQAMIDTVNAEQEAIAASNVVLSQIGLEADNPDSVNSIVTVTQLGTILPALTDINSTNEAAYQDYIDVNPDTFASPATLAEVQAMVDTVNAEQEAIAVSNTVLSQIGLESDDPDSVNSVVTVAQLGAILPALTDINSTNETAYQDYIDTNFNAFSSPATPAEVQDMIDAVNAEQAVMAGSVTITNIAGSLDHTFGKSGILDTTFDLDGIVTHSNIAVVNSSETGNAIISDSSGNIYVAGLSTNGINTDMAIWKYTDEGVLDNTFGTNGIVVYDSGSHDHGYGITLDSLGNVYVTGSNAGYMAIWKYTKNGIKDITFGTNGQVVFVSTDGGSVGNAITLDRTGSIYVTGHMINSIGNKDMAIWKYTSDGVLDKSFSGDGIVRHNFHVSGESNQIGYGITSDSSGNVYVSGSQAYTSNGSTANMVIWKYTSDGIKDTTFGSSGIAMRSGSGRGIILDSLGNVYVTGNNGVNMTIWKCTNDGITDTTFGSNGIVSTLGTGYGITLNSSGSIYVTGIKRNSAGNNDMAIWKYTSTGTLDSNFGSSGIVIDHDAAGGDGHDRGNAITLDKEGSVYVTGSSYNSVGTYDLAIWKYSSSGIVVHDGAAGGYKTDVGNAITYDRFGNVYVTGFSWSSSSSSIDMVTWKYTSSGLLDTSFGTGGIVTQSGTAVGGFDQGNDITVDNMGNIYVTGSVQSTGESMAIWKYTSNGTLDTSFGTDGMVKYINTSVGNAITLDNFGNIYVTGHGKVSSSEVYSHMIIWKYTSDGVLDKSFSGDGVVSFNNDNMPDKGYGIVVDSTHVYVTGYTGYNGNIDMAIWKCASNGVLDSTFGVDSNGMVKYINTNVDFGRGIKLDSAGNIIVTGYSHNSAGNDDIAIWKYTSDGALDSRFGTDGIVVNNSAAGGNGDDRGYGITLDSLDNIYVTGYSLNSSGNNDMAIWKYSNDGTSDTSFGTSGIVIHHNAAGGDSADAGNAITLDNSGSLYVTGYSANGASADMVIWKYLSGIPSELIALDKIKAYADDNTQPSLTVEDYTNAGITGVNIGNLTLINTAIDALVGINVDTASEIQAVVDTVNTTIVENNGLVRYVSTCNELRTALEKAQGNNYNDIIVLTDGTYSTECDGLGTFQYEDFQDYNLTLEGSHQDNVIITGEDTSRVFNFISTAAEAKLVIRNVTIRNGNDTAASLSGGAGVYAEIPQIEIQNSSILSNGGERWGVVRGGGLYLKSSQSVYLKNTSISGNALKAYANNRGAGAYIIAKSIVFEDCNITSNSISQTNQATANGGGLWLSSSTKIDINNTIISGNSIYSMSNDVIGGGAYISVSSQLNISNSRIENNKATGSGSSADAHGAGLYLRGPSKITNTLIKSNRTFTDNVNTVSYAGGIDANDLLMENSTLYGNSSKFYASSEEWGGDFGGALYNGGHVTLVNTLIHSGIDIITVVSDALSDDYGIFNAANSVLTAVNTIFDNVPITGDVTAYGSFDNSIAYRSSISTIINDKNNVSFSSPIYIDASIQDFHPASDSISIDKGLTSYNGITIPNSDFDGNVRPQGITIDIGPYEFVQTPEETSDAVLAQIGNEGDSDDTINSVVTIEQLSAILPPLTGIDPANETIYQDYIDANPDLFSTPATQAEVQYMIDTVNALPTRLPAGISINSASLEKALGSIIDTTPYDIDVQGQIDANGLTVSIPYTVVNAPVTLPAYSTTFEIDSGHTEDGEAGIIATFAWKEQTNLPVGTGTLNATITIDDSNAGIPDDTYNAKKLDIQDDIDGVVVATFPYATDDALGTGTLTLKIYPGIPDRMFGQPDNNGDTTTHMFLYLPVTNPITGKTWLNNNLGANYTNINSPVFNISQQATTSTDYNAYGSLFQWGRKADGHELINWINDTSGGGVNSTTSVNSDNPEHALFITETVIPYDWRVTQDDTLWANEVSTNNVCPIGYRIPNAVDLDLERQSWSSSNYVGALASKLKLTLAGIRHPQNSSVAYEGTYGYYWSSDTQGQDARILNALHGSPSSAVWRAFGNSVRCIKIDPAEAASNAVLSQVGLEADNPDIVNSVVTVAKLGEIQGLTGVVVDNETSYQDYIDTNPDVFSTPATLVEVQSMIDTVNTNNVITYIGSNKWADMNQSYQAPGDAYLYCYNLVIGSNSNWELPSEFLLKSLVGNDKIRDFNGEYWSSTRNNGNLVSVDSTGTSRQYVDYTTTMLNVICVSPN